MEPNLEGQRKPLTAVFADVVDSTRLAERTDPEDWSNLVGSVIGEVTSSVEHYGGTVAQFLGDGVLAIFGAPVAHEDDPDRAVRASLEAVAAVERLRSSPGLARDLGVSIRIGINTGLAVVGSMAAGRGSGYTAIGDAVNVAARVEAAAGAGSVWITAATRRLLGPAVAVEDRGSIDAKGKSERVHVFAVVSAKDARAGRPGVPGLHSPLVGRASEIERLLALEATVRAGRGRAALLLGDPGLGKSRLLEELRSAAAGPLRWVVGNGLSYGHEIPFHVVRQLVRGLAELPADAPTDLTLPALRARLGDRTADGRPAAAVVEHLLGEPPTGPEGERLASLDSLALHAAYAAGVRALVDAAVDDATGAPVALVLEDLHWIDRSSADLLVRLLPVIDERPILLLCTSRPDRDSAGWRIVTAARDLLGPALLEIGLSALSGTESRELIGNLLRIESLPAALRDAMLLRTEGNPFFLEEVVRMLVDRGVIVRSGDQWAATREVEAIDIPDTIHGLLLARIDRLPDEPRRVLRAAAVLGRDFNLPLLEAVTGPAGPALGRLEAAGLVQLADSEVATGNGAGGARADGSAPAREIRYGFRHALIQDAAYESLLKRERRALHLAAAEAIEGLYPERRRELAAVLAGHFGAAESPERAVEYLLIAGAEALRTFADREAYGFFGRAIRLLPERPETEADRRRRVEAGLGRDRAGATFVPYEPSLAELDAILPLADALGDPELLAEIHLGTAQARIEGRGENVETSPALARSLQIAQDLARQTGNVGIEARVLGHLGTSALQTGRYRAATEHFRRAAEAFESMGLANLSSMAYGFAAVAQARLGSFEGADACLDRSRGLAEASGDPNAILDAAIYGGMVETDRGRPALTIQLVQPGIDQADQLGNYACSLVGNFTVGRALLDLGDADGAAVAFERSKDLATFCQAGPIANLSRAWLSALQARHGEHRAGLAGLDEAIREARDLHDRHGEAELLRERAAILAAAPLAEPDRVLADLRDAVAILEEIEAAPSLVPALRQYAAALRVAGNDEEAVAAESRAVGLEATLAGSTSAPASASVPITEL